MAGEAVTGENPMLVDADGADNIPGTEDDDFRLLPGSVCLDTGDNSALNGLVLLDFDEQERIVNEIVDMGSGVGRSVGE